MAILFTSILAWTHTNDTASPAPTCGRRFVAEIEMCSFLDSNPDLQSLGYWLDRPLSIQGQWKKSATVKAGNCAHRGCRCETASVTCRSSARGRGMEPDIDRRSGHGGCKGKTFR